MTSTGPAWRLRELAPLAEVGLRIRDAYGTEPKIAVLSAATLVAEGVGEHLRQLRDNPRVPVLTGDAESLPWAVAATAMLLESDVAEFVPDHFTADGHLDHAAWSALCARARDILANSRDFAYRPTRVPDEVRDRGLIALKQFVTDSADAGGFPIVLLDGPVPAAAALLADASKPGSTAHLVALQPGISRLESAAYERLGIAAILPWHTNLHDGSPAALALEIIDFATAQSARLALASEPAE